MEGAHARALEIDVHEIWCDSCSFLALVGSCFSFRSRFEVFLLSCAGKDGPIFTTRRTTLVLVIL